MAIKDVLRDARIEAQHARDRERFGARSSTEPRRSAPAGTGDRVINTILYGNEAYDVVLSPSGVQSFRKIEGAQVGRHQMPDGMHVDSVRVGRVTTLIPRYLDDNGKASV